MATRYFNTTLGLSMLPDGDFTVTTVSMDEAVDYLRRDGVENVANPSHGNTLQAITQKLGVDVRMAAVGRRVILNQGDACLVAQIGNIPRETREFTDEEIQAANFEFRLVEVK